MTNPRTASPLAANFRPINQIRPNSSDAPLLQPRQSGQEITRIGPGKNPPHTGNEIPLGDVELEEGRA